MSMAILERQFVEPHVWWDRYQDELDEEYRALVEGKTCLDCAKCTRSERHPDIGWCEEDGFVDGDETVRQRGLECFEA